jgi:hypothetical protein
MERLESLTCASALFRAHRNHRVFIRRARPHHVGLAWIGVLGLGESHGFAGRAGDHDVRASDDPMIVRHLASGVRISVAGAVVAAQHIRDAHLVGRRFVLHHGPEELSVFGFAVKRQPLLSTLLLAFIGLDMLTTNIHALKIISTVR